MSVLRKSIVYSLNVVKRFLLAVTYCYTDAAQPMCSGPPPQVVPMVVAQPQPIFGEVPAQITCPNCHQFITTTVEHRGGLLMWIVVGGVCLVWSVINQTRQHLAERCKLRIAKFGYCHMSSVCDASVL